MSKSLARLLVASFIICGPGIAVGCAATGPPEGLPTTTTVVAASVYSTLTAEAQVAEVAQAPPTETPGPAVEAISPTPPPTAQAEATPRPGQVRGRVFDHDTGQPIQGAQVILGKDVTASDGDGEFAFDEVPVGPQALVATKDGYETATTSVFSVNAGELKEVTLRMYPVGTFAIPEDPMATNQVEPVGAQTEADAIRLAQLQGLATPIEYVEPRHLTGDYLVNYKKDDSVYTARATLSHEGWALVSQGREWYVVKACGNLAVLIPEYSPVLFVPFQPAEPTPTPEPSPTSVPHTPTPSEPSVGSTWVRPTDGMEMVYVPAGEFLMGSGQQEIDDALEFCNEIYGDCQRGWFGDEYPQHTLTLDAFWIDKYEVTNAQYRKCVEAGACDEPAFWSDDRFNAPDQPVVGVSWHDPQAYCGWAEARLPTEAEWEKAARGTDGRTYPWGNEEASCQYAVMDDGGNGCGQGDEPWAVGSKPAGASPYGALDMTGNVWEWVADWHAEDYYSHSPDTNPTGPDSGEFRMLRGGSWFDDRYRVRSAYRFRSDPDYTYSSYGFRCGLS